MSETSAGVVRRYLEDAVAAERTFEAQLDSFAVEAGAGAGEVAETLRQCGRETKQQHDQLSARLASLGGTPSVSKGFLAHLFALNPKPVHLDASGAERGAQNLMTAFAVANSHFALYESLAVMAEAASDEETAGLARRLQSGDRAIAQKLWHTLSSLPAGTEPSSLP